MRPRRQRGAGRDDAPLPPLPSGTGVGPRARTRSARLALVAQYNTILSATTTAGAHASSRVRAGSGCNRSTRGPPTSRTGHSHRIRAGRPRRAQACAPSEVERTGADPRCHLDGFQGGAGGCSAADVVLCAANGMGTARLLFLSAHAGAPDGLANSSGLVGRRLMVHPGVLVDGYFDDDLESYRGHFGGRIQSLEFGGTDPDAASPAGRSGASPDRWTVRRRVRSPRPPRSAPTTTLTCDRASNGVSVGRALRGPARSAEPHRASRRPWSTPPVFLRPRCTTG